MQTPAPTRVPASIRTPAGWATARPGEYRWAFLAHPTDLPSYESFDPALGLAGEDVRALFARLRGASALDQPAGLVMGSSHLLDAGGHSTYGEFLALPHDARQLLDLPTAEAVDLIGRAVREAAERGAQVVGLGAYTSVITANATLLTNTPVPVTTGNAYTAAAAVDGVLEALTRTGGRADEACVLVLGASGAIGRAMALMLAEHVGELVLAGNPRGGPRSAARLSSVASDVLVRLRNRGVPAGGCATEDEGALARAVRGLRGTGSGADHDPVACSGGRLRLADDLRMDAARAHVLVAATSSPDLLIDARLPRPGAVVCDVSQPRNTDPRLAQARPDLTVFTGGLVELPGRQDLGLDLALPPGITWACAAETMILAHAATGGPAPAGDLIARLNSVGNQLDVAAAQTLRELGRRFGFRLHLPPDHPNPL